MNSQEFAHLFDKHSVLRELEDELLAGKTRIGIQNCIGSFKAIVLSQLLKSSNRSQLILCDDLEHAENMYSDIEVFMDHNYVFLWKDSFRKSFNLTQSDNAKIQSNSAGLIDFQIPKSISSFLTIQRKNIFKRFAEEFLDGFAMCFFVLCGAKS